MKQRKKTGTLYKRMVFIVCKILEEHHKKDLDPKVSRFDVLGAYLKAC